MQEKVTTVRRRIFLSNTVMVLTTLVLFFMINLVMIKIYAESVEEELILSVENAKNVEMEGGLDELLEGWTIHREQFFIYFGIDGILCIGCCFWWMEGRRAQEAYSLMKWRKYLKAWDVRLLIIWTEVIVLS